MSLLDIVIYPDPVLKTEGRDVETVDDSVRQLIDDLFDTMYANKGVGLAAQQVGDVRRVCVFDVSQQEGEEGEPIALVNPRVVQREGSIRWEEGCLSFPDLYEFVDRAKKVRVEALDRHGNPISIEGEDLLAVVMQHEIDHLDGVLFIDRMSRLKRRMTLKRFSRILEARDAESSAVAG
jgi:peptide deformylase